MENRPIDTFLRITLIAILLVWCFLIARPFLVIIMWALIISVALQPLFDRISKRLKGKKLLASVLLVGVILMGIILPVAIVSTSITRSAKAVIQDAKEGSLAITPPSEKVKEWPVVGKRVFDTWSELSTNLDTYLQDHLPDARGLILKIFGFIGDMLMALGITVMSLLIAGYMMTRADSARITSDRISKLIIGEKGPEFIDIARDTIRSVVKGILLVSLIQAILAYAGFAIAGIPAAGLWAAGVLLLAIIQIPPTLIMIPPIIYMFSNASTTGAIVFMIYSLVVGGADNFLKPALLGRGLKVPSLVILIGALGGMLLHGIIGLFVGAVVLAVGFQLYSEWLTGEKIEVSEGD
ncbi:MAG: AI-2E family transporter [Bacteroidota bacterium]|nr:AI-2E family transporter [Bacteroidota bacterium]